MNKQTNSSWESSAKWYDDIVGEKGHYYHVEVILPKLLSLLDCTSTPQAKILDLACGQAVLARHLPETIFYVGIDLSRTLIDAAKKRNQAKNKLFYHADITKKLPIKEKDFTHATILLALQNIEDPSAVFHNVRNHLIKEGKLFIVLNHPCYRIPRQSSWGVDEGKKIQYRRIDRYMEPLKIPISTHPGKKDESHTWSFHFPLSYYFHELRKAGFVILDLDEWLSNKESTGTKARMENRARSEFPLFLTLIAKKIA